MEKTGDSSRSARDAAAGPLAGRPPARGAWPGSLKFSPEAIRTQSGAHRVLLKPHD